MPGPLPHSHASRPGLRPRWAEASLVTLTLLAGAAPVRAHDAPRPAGSTPAAANPVVTGFAPAEARPGDTLQVFGHHLDQVLAARLGAPNKVRDLRVSPDGTVLTCVVPAQDLPPGGTAVPVAFYYQRGGDLRPAAGLRELRLRPAPPAAGNPAIQPTANPAMTGIAPSVARPGDTLQVFGQHLDQVVAVRLGGPTKVRDLRVSHGGTVLTCVIPAQDLPPEGTSVAVQGFARHGDGLRAVAGSHGLHLLPAPRVDRGLAIPAVTGMIPAEARPGERLALFGRHLDRVTKVSLGAFGPIRHLRVSEGGTVLTGVLPARGLPREGGTAALKLRYRYTADGAVCRLITAPRPLRLLPGSVAAPGARPEVTGLDPAWGPPGTQVTLTGRHLDQVAKVFLGNGQVFLDPGSRTPDRLVFRVDDRTGSWSRTTPLPVTLATAPVAASGQPGHTVVAGTFQMAAGNGAGDPAGPDLPGALSGRVESGPAPDEHRFEVGGWHLHTVYAARVNDRPCALEHLADRLLLQHQATPGDPAPATARITLVCRAGTFQAPATRNLELVCPQGFGHPFRPLAEPAASPAQDPPAIHRMEPAQARPGDAVILHGTGLDRVARLKVDGFGPVEGFQPHPSGSRALVQLPGHWQPEPGAQPPFRLGLADGTEVPSKARLLVLTGAGAAAAEAPGLRLEGLYVTQAVQSLDGQVPLVQGRDACLRAFPVADRDNQARPRLRVTVRDAGGQVRLERDLDLPRAGVPTWIQEPSLRGSYTLPLAGELVQPGLTVTAQLLDGPAAGGPGPALTVAPTVRAVPPVRLVLIPVRIGDRVGRVTDARGSFEPWLATLRKVFPVGRLEVRVGEVWDAPPGSADGPAGMTELVKALEARRTLGDAWNRDFHFGVLPHVDGDCLGLTHGHCGHATSLGRSMVGLDRVGADDPDRFHRTLAHEWGHALGLEHAPAGGAQRTDPRYPVPDGRLDCCGFDVAAQTPIDPRICRDIMGYGGFRWISAYHWRRALDLLTTDFLLHGPRTPAPAAAPAGAASHLHVSGSIGGGKVLWYPALERPAGTAAPESGPYRLLALDADGFVLAEVPFQARPVAGHDLQHFAFSLPMTEVLQGHLATFQVHRDGRALPLRASWNGRPLAPSGTGLGLGEAPAPVARRAADGTVTVAWNRDRHPEGLVLDPVSGAQLGTLSTWTRSLVTDAAELDLRLSDGVRTTRFRVPVLPEA